MLGRGGVFVTALAASVGVPYALTNSSTVKQWGSSASQWAQSTADSDSATDSLAAAGEWIEDQAAAGSEQLEAAVGQFHSAPTPHPDESAHAGSVVVPLEEAFGPQVTPAWVLGRWPRVSTRLADLDLQGYRVPLVTGTRDDDVAGSISYYFDSSDRLVRVVFLGSTGDSRKLAALLATLYGLKRQATKDPRLYLAQVRDDDRAMSELRVWPEDVVKADEPFRRFHVAAWLTRSTTN